MCIHAVRLLQRREVRARLVTADDAVCPGGQRCLVYDAVPTRTVEPHLLAVRPREDVVDVNIQFKVRGQRDRVATQEVMAAGTDQPRHQSLVRSAQTTLQAE